MRKRKNSEEEDSSSEMEVEGEEKEAHDDGSQEEMSQDEGDSHEVPRKATMIENPFLDSFYALSSEDSKERSKAAQTMLQHCLLNSDANPKDAAYAFRRLLNGLCSGRAAARQGNASALSSFLNLAFHLGKMEEIRNEQVSKDETEPRSTLAYVRHRLISITDPNQTTGKKKGSEERDYQFGRLFGILSIVRSNILVTQGEERGYEESQEVATALAADLVDLFWLKRWMREPAAHALTKLLRAFCDSDPGKGQIATHLVTDVIVPKILSMTAKGDEGEPDHSSLIGSFCAEQLGIALFIQSQNIFENKELPFPLDQSCLSKNTVRLLAQALSETSVVVQPRTHFVWDTLWSYVSKVSEEPGKKGQRGPERRVIGDRCPGGNDSPQEVLTLIVREVVMQKLLRLDPDRTAGKATHERRALAMSIVKVLTGTPYASAVSGVTQLYLDGDILEQSILSPEIVRSLFLDVICAGSEKKKTSHLLKPLALEILNGMSQAFVEDPSEGRRLAVVNALLNCELRFDARTKTTTVSDLLGLMQPVQEGNLDSKLSFWNGHLEHLLASFLGECARLQDDQGSAKVTGYVELIYGFSKHVLRLQMDGEKEQSKLEDFKSSVIDRVLKFFFASAFFNCDTVNPMETPKKKKGKKTKKESENPMQSIASQIKQLQSEGAAISHPIRTVISARFFSLLADFSAYRTHAQAEQSDDKVEKDSTTLSVLIKMTECWKALEALGARRFASESKTTKEQDEPEQIVREIEGLVKNATEALSKDPDDVLAYSRKRCCTGIAVLAHALFLHRLSCGESGQESDDPDGDAENDEEEICTSLEGLKDVAVGFMQNPDEDSNPLAGLAELCANLLSSPLGSGNMGRAASPKLIRESIKFAWLGGLRLASSIATVDGSLFDSSVAGILLEAVGAAEEQGEAEADGSDDEPDDSDDEDDNDGSMDDDHVFTKAMDVADDDDPDEIMEERKDDGEESDVELDPTKLQSMLEEDSDADVDDGILEHHEGADAALAKLIRLRQETRKAGKQAREKIELGHQMRCTFLLELLFGRPDSWNRIFRTNILMDIIIPLLRYRKTLERSLKRSLESGAASGENEKQALLDRLTLILSQKICKLKIASLPCAAPLQTESTLESTTEVLGEARRAESKEQSSCSSAALVFVLRSSTNPSAASGLLEEAVSEWSTKRTTKLESSLFDDLILHVPQLASQVLVDPLILACDTARSPFLKAESFRLLTTLFGTPSCNRSLSFLSSVESALLDDEMRKAKRIRVVLKALEKYAAGLSQVSSETVTHLDRISQALTGMAAVESQGLSAICRKLATELETKMAEIRPVQAEESALGPDSSKAAKKKKNKKKKR